MTKNFFYLRFIIIIGIYNLLFSNVAVGNNKLPDPAIKVRTAQIYGNISNLKLSEGEEDVTIGVSVYNPITGQNNYKTNLDKNNRFSLNVPLECSTAIVGFNVQTKTKGYVSCVVGLDQDKELQMNIVFDDKGDMKIDAKGGLNLTSDDMKNIGQAIILFDTHYTWGDYYKMTPEEFAEHELNISLKERTNIALDSLALSEKIREYLVKSFNLGYFKGRLFYYKDAAENSFKGAGIKIPADYKAAEPEKSYYSFLSKFNLNDPQYLYSYSYSGFIKAFLSIKAFNIPQINDMPVDEWLKVVKNKVKDVVGFDSGLFYDMLAANAYAIQLNYRNKPLTNKQLENIKYYYKDRNCGIEDILIKNNKEIIKTLESNKDLKINKTPAIAKEKLMDAIIAKYKGKVVLADFWATWCGPCKSAFTDIIPLKKELKGEDVVFVYVSNVTSPKESWEAQIKVIGGEQYYLTADEWEYILNNLGFDSIPTYLLYDRNGVLKNKVTGFPGKDKMHEMIKKILP